MNKRIIAIALALLLALSAVPTFALSSGADARLSLTKEPLGNTGAIIRASLGGTKGATLTASVSDESLAEISIDGDTVTVKGRAGAVGIARVTVTATDALGNTREAVAEVPVGYTAFYFNGSSVTVIAGSDNKYEVVGRMIGDEDDHPLEESTDTSGNTVYTAPEGTSLCVEIKKAGGAYVFGGKSDDASIAVKKEATGNAFLLLNDLELTSSFTSPITVKKNSNAAVVITSLAGTVNTLSDTELNNEDDHGAAADGGDGSNEFYAESAVIKAKAGATLYLNGEGTLNINGNAKNGIKAGENSSLEIAETVLNVNSVKNGISSENELSIKSGTISVNAASNDGIKAEDDAAAIGSITVTGGDITINAADEGVIAAGSVTIHGGIIDITCGGDAIKAENADETEGDITVTGGSFTINTDCDAFQAAGDLTFRGGEVHATCCGGSANTSYDKDNMSSAKGLKAGDTLTFYGGEFHIDSADDALHSNRNLTILDGKFDLSTTDDGIHADYNLTLGEQGGLDSAIDLTVNTCYEGIEGATIRAYSGNYTINCNEDCINAANSDLGGYAFSLRFYGGNFHCYGGSGDGLDSNGELYNLGANIEVYSPGRSNAALDSDGTMGLLGGTTMAVGSGDMVETPNSGIYVRFGSSGWGSSSFSFANGDAIAVYDASNNLLFSSTVRYHNTNLTSSSVIFSCPQLVSGSTYYLYKNGSRVATASATGSAGNAPSDSTSTAWQSVGEVSEVYTRTSSLITGIGGVITSTASTSALAGGTMIGASAVTVSSTGGGYLISGLSDKNIWYRSSTGKLYCVDNGTKYYLAYNQTGSGWYTSYAVSVTTDEASAPAWSFTASGNYVRVSTAVAGQGGPGGGGPERALYLAASGSSFTVSTNASNLILYAPDSALASLEGTKEYFVNLENGESVTESEILSGAVIRFKSGTTANEEVLPWSDSRVSYEWSPVYSQTEAGEYTLTVSVLGTKLGTIRVIAVDAQTGSTAPVPPDLAVPEPPDAGILGDVDGNGEVSVIDALLALRCAMGLVELNGGEFTRADIDSNGTITVIDAVTILRMALGLLS